MRRYSLLLLAVCAFSDELVLKNGDKLSGQIVKKDGDKVVIKTADAGSVTLKWSGVKTLTADTPITVVLSDSRVIRGTIVQSGDALAIGEERFAFADIVALRDAGEQVTYEKLQDPGMFDLWAGTATLGIAGTEGNAETRTLTGGLSAARLTLKDKTNIYFAGIRASALIGGTSATTAQAIRSGLAYSHNVSSRTFLNVFNDYEYDRFQNLDLRFVLGGGAGYIPWRAERGRLDLLAGANYNRESFGPPAPAAPFTRNSAEAYFGDDLTYQLNGMTSLVQKMRFFTNLTDTGAYRANFDLAANTRIFKWLVWNIAVSDRYLSNPIPGRKKNDFLYTTGIGVTFSR